jgi:predicted component of type VI protein secretion system
MIFLSQEGDLYFDKFFGLELWNHNFESKKLRHDEKKQIEDEIVRVIDRYEDRLKKGSHQVQVSFDDETKLISGKKAELHILTIHINSVLNEDLKSKENSFFHIFKVPVKIYYKT